MESLNSKKKIKKFIGNNYSNLISSEIFQVLNGSKLLHELTVLPQPKIEELIRDLDYLQLSGKYCCVVTVISVL